MEDGDRIGLINQLGFTMGFYMTAMTSRDYALARKHLVKLYAGLGMLAMELDELDPVEREN